MPSHYHHHLHHLHDNNDYDNNNENDAQPLACSTAAFRLTLLEQRVAQLERRVFGGVWMGGFPEEMRWES
jgi:hypothetical protein